MLEYIMGCLNVIQIQGIDMYQCTYHQYMNSKNPMKGHFTGTSMDLSCVLQLIFPRFLGCTASWQVTPMCAAVVTRDGFYIGGRGSGGLLGSQNESR